MQDKLYSRPELSKKIRSGNIDFFKDKSDTEVLEIGLSAQPEMKGWLIPEPPEPTRLQKFGVSMKELAERAIKKVPPAIKRIVEAPVRPLVKPEKLEEAAVRVVDPSKEDITKVKKIIGTPSETLKSLSELGRRARELPARKDTITEKAYAAPIKELVEETFTGFVVFPLAANAILTGLRAAGRTNIIRKLLIKERGIEPLKFKVAGEEIKTGDIAKLPDDEFLEVYKTLPDNLRKPFVKTFSTKFKEARFKTERVTPEVTPRVPAKPTITTEVKKPKTLAEFKAARAEIAPERPLAVPGVKPPVAPGKPAVPAVPVVEPVVKKPKTLAEFKAARAELKGEITPEVPAETKLSPTSVVTPVKPVVTKTGMTKMTDAVTDEILDISRIEEGEMLDPSISDTPVIDAVIRKGGISPIKDPIERGEVETLRFKETGIKGLTNMKSEYSPDGMIESLTDEGLMSKDDSIDDLFGLIDTEIGRYKSKKARKVLPLEKIHAWDMSKKEFVFKMKELAAGKELVKLHPSYKYVGDIEPGYLWEAFDAKLKGKPIPSAKPLTSAEIRKIRAGLGEVTPAVKAEPVSQFNTGTGRVKATKGLASMEGARLDRPTEFQPATSDPNFKLWQSTEKIINKYAMRFGEGGYMPRGAVGLFYPASKNIYLQSANNVYAAIHEVVHYIDVKVNWFKPILAIKGRSITGNPIYSPATREIRKALSQFYVEYYPTGKMEHPLKKRVQEGIATLIMKAVEEPEILKNKKWDYLTANVLTPGAKYYRSEFSELIKDGQGVMDKYRSLDPIDQISARTADVPRLEPKPGQFVFSKFDAIQEFLFNRAQVIETMSNDTGWAWTNDDPFAAVDGQRMAAPLAENNITRAGDGFRTLNKDGNVVKVLDGNIKDLFDMVGNIEAIRRYNGWLIARLVRGNYLTLDKKGADLLKLTEGSYNAASPDMKVFNEWLANQKVMRDSFGYRDLIKKLKADINSFKKLDSVIRKDKVPRAMAEGGYNMMAEDENYKVWTELFDEINKADLTMYRDMGLVSQADYERMLVDPTYASSKRNVDGDLFGVVGGKGKASLAELKQRTGSDLPYTGPLYGLVIDHANGFRVAVRQYAYNKIYKMAAANQEFFSNEFKPEKLITKVEKDGSISYPQLMDPNILMARENGKYLPLVVHADLKKKIDLCLSNPMDVDIFEKVATTVSRIFVKGTTGTYIPFPIANLPIDTIAGMIQSRTNYIPVYTQVKQLKQALLVDGSKEAEWALTYLRMGGMQNTLAGHLDAAKTPDEMYRLLTGEVTGIQRVLDAGGRIIDLISKPSQYSEIITRMAEFISMKADGKNDFVAFRAAGEVTTPFHRKGTWGGQTGRTLTASIPFLNPGFQVLAQEIRVLRDPKTRGRALMGTLMLAVAAVGSDYYLRRKASPAQIANYKGKQTKIKENYFLYPSPTDEGRKNGTLYRVRIPSNYGFIGSIITMIIDDHFLKTKYSKLEYVDAVLSPLPEQLNPQSGVRFLLSWMPHIIAPALQVTVGKKFFPGVMPIISGSVSRLARERQITKYTSWAAKKAANTKLAAALNLSPIEIDFLVEGYFSRSSRAITGKEAATSPFYVDLYLNSTRSLEFFYNLRDEIRDIKSNIAEAERLEEEFIITPERDRAMMFEVAIQSVEVKLARYRKLNKIKEPSDDDLKEIADIRNNVLDEVDTLWDDYDNMNPEFSTFVSSESEE